MFHCRAEKGRYRKLVVAFFIRVFSAADSSGESCAHLSHWFFSLCISCNAAPLHETVILHVKIFIYRAWEIFYRPTGA